MIEIRLEEGDVIGSQRGVAPEGYFNRNGVVDGATMAEMELGPNVSCYMHGSWGDTFNGGKSARPTISGMNTAWHFSYHDKVSRVRLVRISPELTRRRRIYGKDNLVWLYKQVWIGDDRSLVVPEVVEALRRDREAASPLRRAYLDQLRKYCEAGAEAFEGRFSGADDVKETPWKIASGKSGVLGDLDAYYRAEESCGKRGGDPSYYTVAVPLCEDLRVLCACREFSRRIK